MSGYDQAYDEYQRLAAEEAGRPLDGAALFVLRRAKERSDQRNGPLPRRRGSARWSRRRGRPGNLRLARRLLRRGWRGSLDGRPGKTP
jgi:hypothetical protein